MKKIRLQILIIPLTIILTSCNINISKGGLKAADYKTELQIAKKSLQFINSNEPDSLKAMFNPKISRNLGVEQMDWLMKESSKILSNYNFPTDSMITVKETINNSITGETVYREFVFPFELAEFKDSTKYLKITIANNELHKFLISSGFQFMN